MIQWLQRGLPALILVIAALLRVQDPVFLSDLRLRVFDAFQRLSPRIYEDVPVRVIDIDDETIRRFGQWPWPRSQTAELVRRLGEAGASAIALDIVFSEKDRTAPDQVLPSWRIPPDDPLAIEIGRRALDPDRAFAETIAKAPVILGFVLADGVPNRKLPKRKGGMAMTGSDAGRDPRNFVPKFSGAIASLPELQAKARGQGSINVITTGDAVVRRLPMLLNGGGTLFPSLAAEAMRVSQKASTFVIKASGAEGYQEWWQRLAAYLAKAEGVAEIKIGKLMPLTDASGQVWLYDSGRIKERSIPAWRILEGEKIDLRGKILFVGTSAPGLMDLRASPNASVVPGVELHAQIVEQILTGRLLNRPYWTVLPELAFLLVSGLTMILLLPRAGPIGCALVGAGAVGSACLFAWLAFIREGQLFDPVYPSLSAMLVFISGAMFSFFRTDVERKSVRAAFGHYLAPEMVERLAADPSNLKLGGEMRPVTVLFCDIRDFTTISERTDARRLTHLLNQFLTPMTDAVLQHHGTIDKYIGDSIMAFWNAPLDDPAHAANACLAALDMRRRLADLNTALVAEAEAQGTTFEPLRMGIGLNSGPCLVGNLGSRQRFNYSVIGDDVNLASRIEGVTKTYGVDILIGEETQRLAPDFALLHLGEVMVKGKSLGVKVFALIGGPELAADPRFRHVGALLSEVIAALKIGETENARRYLARCREADPGLGLDALYTHLGAAIERQETDRTKRLGAAAS